MISALSVRQPWAHLIRERLKTVEVRSQPTRHRGELLICASKALDDRARAIAMDYELTLDLLPLGAAVAWASLVDCRPFTAADEPAALVRCIPGQERFAWVLEDIQPIYPRTVRGQLGIFSIDDPFLERMLRPSSGRYSTAAARAVEPAPGVEAFTDDGRFISGSGYGGERR